MKDTQITIKRDFKILLSLWTNFLKNRKQRVVLNRQCSSWANASTGVPQGSLLNPRFFLIFINNLSCNLKYNHKLFADDTSLFSTVRKSEATTNILNSDLKEISKRKFWWIVSVNLDPSKHMQAVIFNKNTPKDSHSKILFHRVPVLQVYSHKHLEFILDSKLTFCIHTKTIMAKVNKATDLIPRFQRVLPRASLVTIHKVFMRPHLDYGDIIFYQAFHNSVCKKMESVQYDAALPITGIIKETSKKKFYQEQGFESLRSTKWFSKLSLFYKLIKNENSSPINSINSINSFFKPSTTYSLRNSKNVALT